MKEIFISYKRVDEAIAFDIVSLLENEFGIDSCWIDSTGIESGEYFRDTIMSAIRDSCVVLFLMSKTSVVSSSSAPTWVQREVLYAIKKGKRVIPISIDGTQMDDCDWLLFECGELDFIDWNNQKQRYKLIDNIRNRGISKSNSEIQNPIRIESVNQRKIDNTSNNIGLIVWAIISVISLISVSFAIYCGPTIPSPCTALFGICAVILSIILIASLVNPKILFFNKKGPVFLYLLPLLLFTSAAGNGIEDTEYSSDIEEINNIEVIWSEKCTESQKAFIRDIILNLVYVEGGFGQIGTDDFNSYKDERPKHQVQINDFYISKFEITQAQWLSITGYNPSKIKGDQNPVENVSFNDIVHTFLPKLKELSGLNFRLPTEEEWEYSAMGGNKSLGFKFSGSNQLSEVGWYDDNSTKKHYPVGSLNKANELGLYDMSGNVWEWTSSLWSDNYLQDRKGGSTGNLYVRRGGSWYNDSKHCTNTCRGSSMSDKRSKDLGFRLAL